MRRTFRNHSQNILFLLKIQDSTMNKYCISATAIFVAVTLTLVSAEAKLASWSVSGTGPSTAIKYNITAIEDDKFQVQLEATKDFPSQSYIALGLSRTPSMPHSFIVMCAKNKSGQLVTESRYAYARVTPPKTDWGLILSPSSNNNTLNGRSGVLPATLRNSTDEGEKRPVNLISGDDPLYILLSLGDLDETGEPQYHGASKEVLHESGRQYVASLLDTLGITSEHSPKNDSQTGSQMV